MLQKLDLPVIATGPMQIEGRAEGCRRAHEAGLQREGRRSQGQRERHAEGTQPGGRRPVAEARKTGSRLPCSKRSNYPLFAAGPMRIDTRIKDVGAQRQLDLKAKFGDLSGQREGHAQDAQPDRIQPQVRSHGWRTRRDLPRCSTSAGVPAAPLKVSGHTVHSRKEIKFDVADRGHRRCVRARRWQHVAHRQDQDRAEFRNWRPPAWRSCKDTWPEMKVSASGGFEHAQRPYRTERSASHPGQDPAGRFAVVDDGAKHIEAQLSSPRLDLTPFFPQEQKAEAADGTKPPPPPRVERAEAAEEEVRVQRDAAEPRQDEGHRCEGASGLRRTGARRSVNQGSRQQPAGGSRQDDVRPARGWRA